MKSRPPLLVRRLNGQGYIVIPGHGAVIARGETICLMEAMKMISEIPTPCDCIITRIYKENGELAGFDEPLFGYRPC